MIRKFRGKCPDGGWIVGSLVKFDENTCFIMPEYRGASTLSYAQIFNHTAQYVDLGTVGQSLGVNDQNGREIFDGDIYRYKYWSNAKDYFYRFSYVHWEKCETPYEGTYYGYDIDVNEIEVVGNIYDNQELLEEIE
ncbi:MAG: YopX family protein [Enterococcus sp.]